MVFLTLLSSSIFAIDDNIVFTTTPSTTTCLDNQTAMWSWTYTNVSNTTQWYVISKSFTCNNNCSSILADCRATESQQFLEIIFLTVGVFAICFIFAAYIGRKALMIDFPIYAILMLFLALYGGSYDIYNPEFRTIILSLFFIPLACFFYSLWRQIGMRKEGKEEKRATGR